MKIKDFINRFFGRGKKLNVDLTSPEDKTATSTSLRYIINKEFGWGEHNIKLYTLMKKMSSSDREKIISDYENKHNIVMLGVKASLMGKAIID